MPKNKDEKKHRHRTGSHPTRQALIDDLEACELRYKAITEFLPLMICNFQPDGRITFVNRAYTECFEKKADDLVGTRFLDLIPESEQQEVMERILSLTPGNPVLSHDHRVLAPDGEVRWHRWTNRAIISESGRICGYQAVGEDITHRKQVEEGFQESENRFRVMMESMTDPVYICSPEFTVEYANPAMIRRVGRNPLGESCHSAMHGMDTRCDWCVMDKVSDGRHMETTITSPRDNRTFRVTNMPIENRDGTVSKMTIFRDITDYLAAVEEQKKSRARLRQSQRMEAIGTMAGGIAHDFNNILTAILGYAQLSMALAGDNKDLKKDIQEILTAGERARDLIHQILTFARQSDEKLSPIRVDLIAKEVLRLVRSTIPASIQIDSNILTQARIMGNVSQVHQIFMNLITNAAFAMEDTGGTLSIDVENAGLADLPETAGLQGASFVRIRVSDTGTGMPRDILKSIFEPYFTTKRKGEGTGMGLAVVHGIVEKYKGAIFVDSTPRKGTVFTVYLPESLDRPGRPASVEETLPGGNETILFVDDESPIVKVGRRMLGKLGYNVITETQSRKALELFRSSPDDIDLVITDMTMPGMTGDLMAVEMLTIRPDLPVIICTGYSRKMAASKAARLGISAFFRKPMDFNTLSRTIRRLLDESGQAEPGPKKNE